MPAKTGIGVCVDAGSAGYRDSALTEVTQRLAAVRHE
jgi:hypothetical protein